MGRIADGEVEKVVIARDLLATSSEPLDVPALLARLQEANTASWTFHVDGLVGSSPEMLVAIDAATACARRCSPARRR